MKVDGGFGYEEDFRSTEQLKSGFEHFERLGFDGVLVAEIAHDPFMPLMLGAGVTGRIDLRTSIAVAFSRNPMSMAYAAHDLNAYSKGRFTLGLGSQIRAHVVKRFGMPWHAPAAQMREYIRCLNAIWNCWYDGAPLDFRGEYYQHHLMTPDFTPKNIEFGRPRVTLAAVGPLMTRVAAEEADGIIIHSFSTEKYIRESLIPRITEALDGVDKSLGDFEISYPAFVVTGESEEEIQRNREFIKYRIAFYASTPAYKGVLDCHGWGDLQPELNRLSKENKWNEMSALISDEILAEFAVIGSPTAVAAEITARYGDLVDRVTLEAKLPDEVIESQLEILRG